jgi:small-conductance mechanosensitive channel
VRGFAATAAAAAPDARPIASTSEPAMSEAPRAAKTDPLQLEPSVAPPPKELPRRQKLWLRGYVAALVVIGVAYYLVRLDVLPLPDHAVALARQILLGAAGVTLTLLVARLVDAYAIGRVTNAVTRYNLERVVRLIVYLVLAAIAVSALFANWYAAVASLGLISLVLGFALQTPITSFIGWVYILVRRPYRVGDRISIEDATGDVIDVAYFDTTLWEVGGPYVSRNHPSGRLIKFPNAKVLTTAVYNFSWEMFPYIWDEITLQVAYNSDLAFVGDTMRAAAVEELGEAMIERVRKYREILATTPVDEVQVHERPSVIFRVNTNTWIDATVRYVVDPKRAGGVKTRLLSTMLAQLNAQPGRVLFPKGDNR